MAMHVCVMQYSKKKKKARGVGCLWDVCCIIYEIQTRRKVVHHAMCPSLLIWSYL